MKVENYPLRFNKIAHGLCAVVSGFGIAILIDKLMFNHFSESFIGQYSVGSVGGLTLIYLSSTLVVYIQNRAKK
ncbi:MAG: hypothetical protein ACI9E5_000991 [Candidatus Omnitrophota bacterium]|jgi:hypothetical protein